MSPKQLYLTKNNKNLKILPENTVIVYYKYFQLKMLFFIYFYIKN